MQPIGPSTILQNRFLSTLNGMHLSAQHLDKTCTTAEDLYVHTNSGQQTDQFLALLKPSVGGLPVFLDGPAGDARPLTSADIADTLKTFPGVVSVSGSKPGQKPALTVTTQNADQQKFLQTILQNHVKLGGVQTCINFQAQH